MRFLNRYLPGRQWNKRLLQLIAGSYCVLLLTLLLLAVPGYNLMAQVTGEICVKNGEQALILLSNNLNLYLDRIHAIMDRISIGNEVNNFYFRWSFGLIHNEYILKTQLKDICSMLNKELYYEDSIMSIYLYMPYCGQVVTNTSIHELEEFADADFIHSTPTGISLTTARRTAPHIRVVAPYMAKNKEYPAISLTKWFPSGRSASDRMLLVINIEQRALQHLLTDVEAMDYAYCITLEDGSTLLSSGSSLQDGTKTLQTMGIAPQTETWTQDLGGERILVSRADVVACNWHVYLWRPLQNVLRPLKRIQEGILLLLLACAIFGLTISATFSIRYYKPFAYLRKRLEPQEGTAYTAPVHNRGAAGAHMLRDDVLVMARIADALVDRNERDAEVLRENMPVILRQYLLDLFMGKRPHEEWKKLLSFSYSCFTVFCLEPIMEMEEIMQDSAMSVAGYRAIMLIACEKSIRCGLEASDVPVSVFFAEDARGCLAVLLNHDVLVENTTWKPLLERIQDEIQSNQGLSTFFGVGGSYSRVEEIPQSYSEAQKALRWRAILGKNMVVGGMDERNGASGLDISAFQEHKHRLVEAVYLRNQAMINGRIDALSSSLTHISPEEFTYVRILFSLLCQELSLSVTIPNVDETLLSQTVHAVSRIQKACALDELIGITRAHAHWLAQLLFTKHKSLNQEVIQQTIAYIEAHASEDFGIETIAEKVHLRPAYLGQSLKAATGKTFPQLVTQARMARARDSIAKTDMDIRRIYEDLGYNSYQNFARVFRRHYGMSPSEYRRLHAHENIREATDMQDHSADTKE